MAVKLLDLENLNCSLVGKRSHVLCSCKSSSNADTAVPCQSQEEIVREAQTMRQQHHPNVLPLHCSFVHQQNLWMVMPYVAGGSVLNLMKFAYSEVGLACNAQPRTPCLNVTTDLQGTRPACLYLCPMQGLEEPVIATILKEVLKGLDYMHRHGGIHRDIKVVTPTFNLQKQWQQLLHAQQYSISAANGLNVLWLMTGRKHLDRQGWHGFVG